VCGGKIDKKEKDRESEIVRNKFLRDKLRHGQLKQR
jgi:hypothetical protein